MTGTSKPNSLLPFVEEATVEEYISKVQNAWQGDHYTDFILHIGKSVEEENFNVFLIAQAYLQNSESNLSCLELGYVTFMALNESGKLPKVSEKIYADSFLRFGAHKKFQSHLITVQESLQMNNEFLATLFHNVDYNSKRCALHIYGALEMQALTDYKKISKASAGQKVLADEAEYFQGDLRLNAEIAFLTGNGQLAARIRDAQKK